jgi:hypothetical protein
VLSSLDNIILLWEALMLEKKIFITSNNKENLCQICMALISLLFPFKWIHVLIPVLPEKLKVFIDAPVPLLIGLCYKYNLNEFPSDAIVYNLDSDTFEKYNDKFPKLPSKLFASLHKRLEKFKKKFHNPDDLIKVQYSEDVFNTFVDVIDDTKVKFNSSEVRDAFYEFYINLFKNYEKYFPVKGKNEISKFIKDLFLKDNSANDVNYF